MYVYNFLKRSYITCNVILVSPPQPLEFSVSETMLVAFERLLKKFRDEFQQPYPCGPTLFEVKLWCIVYCTRYELDETDFSEVSSMENVFFKIAKLNYCNILTLGLLEHLAERSKTECLIISIANYDRTFYNAQLKDQLSITSDGTVKTIRSLEFKSKRGFTRSKRWYTRAQIYTRSMGKRMTCGKTQKLRNNMSRRIFHIPHMSLTICEYGEGSVYLGWEIPSCLVEAAYHAACTNTALFAQLGIKYIIIERYKIEPPTTCVRGMYDYIYVCVLIAI